MGFQNGTPYFLFILPIVLEELGTLESSTPTRLSGIHQALEIGNLFVMVGFHPCVKRLEHFLDGIRPLLI